MQRYYRTLMDVQLLNELLLQLFREAILERGHAAQAPDAAVPGARRLARSRQRRPVQPPALRAAGAVRAAAAAPAAARRARRHDARGGPEPVADR